MRSMQIKGDRQSIGVIGGGFTGAILAVHLARAAPRSLAIDIIEPREALGAGLAYGSCSPEHRINVPSERMFIFADDPQSFTHWLKRSGAWQADAEALTAQGHHYSARRDFAAYMAELVAATAADNPSQSALRHVQCLAMAIENAGGRWRIALGDGASNAYDHVVLCATHEAPAFRWPLVQGAEELPHLVRNPWRLDALAAIPASASVMIFGTGLTMCDAVITLRENGHRGPVHAISRRALTSRPQGAFDDDFDLFGHAPRPGTALGLLRLVRRRIEEAAGDTLPWHAVIDAVRRSLPSYWPTLPMAERAKIARHLRSFWDVHRFRMAPQVERAIARGQREGWLRLSAGRIHEIGREEGRFSVVWTPRRAARQTALADAIINCTGPDSNLASSANPILRSALDAGLIRPDALRIGLDVDSDGRLLRRDGGPNAGLWAAGPLARIIVGEATGIPEASAHARHVAIALGAELGSAEPAQVPSGELA
jgi:uncharacterized NAD(P)/FAD-binding protein YdhS